MPTARNARGIDLLAYDANARQHLGIQVKALASRNAAVPLGSKSLEDLLGDWWIVVASTDENPECFIMTPEEVRQGAEHDSAYWLPRREYAVDKYREAWHRIGRGDVIAERFAKPIRVPEGRLIRTVTDARLYVAALRKPKRLRSEWQTVAQMLRMAVEGRVSLKSAQIALAQAVNAGKAARGPRMNP